MLNEGTTSIYVGDTGTGKTYLAVQHWRASLCATRRPGIVIDGMAASNFDALRAAHGVESCQDAIAAIRAGRHVVWTPETPDDCEEFFAWVKRLKGYPLAILVDETSPWMSAYTKPANLMFLIRSHRHRGHYLYLTTQYLGDFPPAVLQCLTHVHIFRSTAPATIDRLAATFPRLDLAAIQSLPDRQKLEFSPRVPPAAPEKA